MRELLARSEPARSELQLSLLHVSRATAGSRALGAHFEHVLPPDGHIAFVDSGCYGSLLPLIVQESTRRGCGDPAVIFYSSRNPLVFGYMNYLAASAELARPHHRGARSQLDFAIYAGDVLETIPKGYRARSLDARGHAVVRPQDLVSYVLARTVFWALSEHATQRPPDAVEGQAAVAAAERLYQVYNDDVGAESLLLREPAPKSIPAGLTNNSAYRQGFPPQDEFFGVVSG